MSPPENELLKRSTMRVSEQFSLVNTTIPNRLDWLGAPPETTIALEEESLRISIQSASVETLQSDVETMSTMRES